MPRIRKRVYRLIAYLDRYVVGGVVQKDVRVRNANYRLPIVSVRLCEVRREGGPRDRPDDIPVLVRAQRLAGQRLTGDMKRISHHHIAAIVDEPERGIDGRCDRVVDVLVVTQTDLLEVDRQHAGRADTRGREDKMGACGVDSLAKAFQCWPECCGPPRFDILPTWSQ